MSVAAGAADLVRPTAPAMAASWAGFYLGIHGGYGWKQDGFRQPVDLVTAGHFIDGVRSQGAVYGGQFGHNWQYGRLVAGIEADFSATDIRGSSTNSEMIAGGGAVLSASATWRERVKYLGTARLRAGWQAADNILLYGTAGLAWERLDFSQRQFQQQQGVGVFILGDADQRAALDKFGWAAGVGLEAMLGSANWVGRVEYLHYDFGSVAGNNLFASNGTVRVGTAGSQTIDLVRAGISYKFAEPATSVRAMPAKAPFAALPASWAGFYLGAHGGYGWGSDPYSFPIALFDPASPDTLRGINSRGWIAGAHMGHNWQYGRAVAGIETDLDAADIRGSSSAGTFAAAPNTVTARLEDRIAYLGTLRGRLGWVATEDLLLYGTAGLAWERHERILRQSVAGGGGTAQGRSVTPEDRFGFVVGAGAEVTLGSSNWVGRVEYLHYDFDKVRTDGTFAVVQPGINVATTITGGRQTIDVVRAGVSYKIGATPSEAVTSSMPYAKAPRALPPGWGGFYLGTHGGYGWMGNDFAVAFDTGALIGGINSRGWIAGGQGGYNWQIGKIVAGFELDGSATGINGSTAPTTSATRTETWADDVKYLGTLRTRLGWTPTETVLVYGTGGLAWERTHRTNQTVTAASFSIDEFPRDRFGWVAGVGGELMLTADRKWIGRAEYLHYDFGPVESAATFVSTIPGNPTVIERAGRQTIDLLRAGLSYRFTP